MQSFSIIIPLLENQLRFEDTVASVLRYCQADTQVIVVADTDYVDPHRLESDGVEVIRVEKPNLIECFNHGVMAAKGEIVGMLRPGIELIEGWHKSVANEFSNPSVGSVSPIVVAANRPNKVVTTGVELGIGFKRHLAGTGMSLSSIDSLGFALYAPTSWAGFYRGEMLSHLMREVDKIDRTLDPHYLDLELGLCMATMGFACSLCHDCVITTSNGPAIRKEAVTPHGRSAQRAYCRHVLHVGSTNNFAESTAAKITEIVTSPFAMWKLKHAMQRSEARRFREKDEIFSDDISVAARKLRRNDTRPELKLYVPEVEEFEDALERESAIRNPPIMVSEKRKNAMLRKQKRQAA